MKHLSSFIGAALALVGVVALAPQAQAGYGYFGTGGAYAIVDTNGNTSGGTYFDIGANNGNTDFQGFDLGTYLVGSTQLRLNGFEGNTYENGSDNAYTGSLLYRIFPTGSPAGAYTTILPLNYVGNPNGFGGTDEQHATTTAAINVVGALGVGNYTLEVYAQTLADWNGGVNDLNDRFWVAANGGTLYQSAAQSPALYGATFTVIPEPASAIALMGVLGAGLGRRVRRRA